MNSRMLILRVILIVILASAAIAFPMIQVEDGRDRSFWQSHAIVVAYIRWLQPDREKRVFRIEADVRAVIATDFMVPTTLPIVEYRVGVSSAITRIIPRPEGMLVIMCIRRDGNVWMIPPSVLTFFESDCGIQKVKSMDDPALYRVAAKVSEVRAIAHTRPAR